MFSISENNTHPPGLIWLNLEGHIFLKLTLKKIANNCFWELFLFVHLKKVVF